MYPDFDSLNNEIIEQTSIDWYHFDGPHMNTFPGKFYQQDLHHWYHSHNYAKWYYWKDPNNGDWAHFYTALHNPPSEKIVDMYYNYWWGGQCQIWALGQNGHLFSVGYNANGEASVPTTLNVTDQTYTEYFNQVYTSSSAITDVVKLVPLCRAFIKADGTLWTQNSSVGANGYYEFSQDTGITGVYKVTTNSSRSAWYALKQDGTVWVKGSVANANTDSLGLGAVTNTSGAWTQIPGLTNIKDISTTCYTYGQAVNENFAINTSGKVWAWGYDTHGNLANGTVDGLVTTPTACSKVTSLNVQQVVSLAGNCTLFLTTSGLVYYVGDYSADSTDTVSNTVNAKQITGIANIKNIYFESKCFCAWLVTNNGFVYTVEAQNKTLNDLNDIRVMTDWNFCVDIPANNVKTYTANSNTYYYKQTCAYDTTNAATAGANSVKVVVSTVMGTSTSYGTTFDEKVFEFTENGTYKMKDAETTLSTYMASVETALKGSLDLTTTTTTGNESTNSGAKAYWKITYTPKFVAGVGISIDYSMVWGLNTNYGVDVDSGNYELGLDTYTNRDANLYSTTASGSISKTLLDNFKTNTIGFLKVAVPSAVSENYTSSITGLSYTLTTTYSQGATTTTSNTVSWTTSWYPSTSTSTSFTYGTSSNTQFTSANYTNAANTLANGGTSQRTALKSYLDTLIGDVTLPTPNPKTSTVTTNSGRTLYLRTTYTKV